MLKLAWRSLWSRKLTYGLVFVELMIGFLCLTLAISIWTDIFAMARRLEQGGPRDMRVVGLYRCTPGQAQSAVAMLRQEPGVARMVFVRTNGATQIGDSQPHTLLIDRETAADFPLTVTDGRWFVPEDFVPVDGAIPVVLGSAVLPELGVGALLPVFEDVVKQVVVGRLAPGQQYWLPNLSPADSVIATDDLIFAPPHLRPRMFYWFGGDAHDAMGRLLIYPHPGRGEEVAAAVARSGLEGCFNGNQTIGEALASHYKGMRPLLALTGFLSLVILSIGTLGFIGITMVSIERRAREFAIRLAVGATPWGLARQVLTEMLLLCGLAALLGIPLARLLAGAMLIAVRPTDILLAVSAGLSVALLAGFWPVWQITRRPPASYIRGGR